MTLCSYVVYFILNALLYHVAHLYHARVMLIVSINDAYAHYVFTSHRQIHNVAV